MKIRHTLLVALTLLCAVSQSRATDINFTSPFDEIAKSSAGVALPDTFTFYIGSFSAFVPTVSNTNLWAANFTSLGSTTWSSGDHAFSGSVQLTSNAGAFLQTNQAYIWGQGLVSGSAEQVLFTNNTWLFPASSNILPTNWDLSDSGTFAVVGTLGTPLVSADPYISTVAVSAVPEPATYAAVLGLLAVGLVAYRRRVAA